MFLRLVVMPDHAAVHSLHDCMRQLRVSSFQKWDRVVSDMLTQPEWLFRNADVHRPQYRLGVHSDEPYRA